MLALVWLRRLVILSPLLIDAHKSGLAWGPFFRIRMDADITKPLMKGKMVHFEDVGEGWVFFKNKSLPIFCYCCGILSHQDRECKKVIKGCLSLDDDGFQFGP